jgi:hypothetical protein
MEPGCREADSPTTEPTGQDFGWSALLEAYRTVSRKQSSGLLVERLGPWLTKARQRLVAVPPYLDEEDVAQQLVVEVLRIAARWRPTCEDCWIPRKLVEPAERAVRRALFRAESRATEPLDDELLALQRAEPELLFDTPIGTASAADLRLIYRVRVLGEGVADLAARAGITPRQMRQRVFAARQRARTPIAAEDEKA